MKYTKPDLDKEWMEALRYREFEKMGKDKWMEIASENFTITSYDKIKDVLGNVDLDFDTLDFDKKKRFEKHFEEGSIEMPIAVKFSDTDYDLLGGNTRLSGLIGKGINPKLYIVDISKGTQQETKEQTSSDASGSFAPALDMGKKVITKVPNLNLKEEEEFTEATDSSSSGAFDVPLFGTSPKGRRDPLKIDGPKSIGNSRAVKDKKFPKWGGPNAVFVKIKEKCKKFPYCNQGDINAIELLEIEELKESILETSKEMGLPYKEVENIVLNEIKKIFI
jgi:hypothetical protein